jgi:hypothetical protein
MISGKSFADRCQWIIDPRYLAKPFFVPSLSKPNDWLFINGDYIYMFFDIIRVAFFPKKYTIIIHNTDRSFGQSELERLLPHANHIYAINTTIVHPKLTTIPLGFVDRQLPFLNTFHPESVSRDIEIYVNFTRGTNQRKRQECLDAIKGREGVVYKTDLTVPEYYADLSRSKFVLCPEGTGIDTHRVYESLLCGATPVVLRNSLSHMYAKLPVCIVDKWTDPFYKPNQIDINWSIHTFLT